MAPAGRLCPFARARTGDRTALPEEPRPSCAQQKTGRRRLYHDPPGWDGRPTGSLSKVTHKGSTADKASPPRATRSGEIAQSRRRGACSPPGGGRGRVPARRRALATALSKAEVFRELLGR